MLFDINKATPRGRVTVCPEGYGHRSEEVEACVGHKTLNRSGCRNWRRRWRRRIGIRPKLATKRHIPMVWPEETTVGWPRNKDARFSYLLRSKGVLWEADGRLLYGRMPLIFRGYGTGRWKQGREKIGRRWSGRSWPENLPKRQARWRRRRKRRISYRTHFIILHSLRRQLRTNLTVS